MSEHPPSANTTVLSRLRVRLYDRICNQQPSTPLEWGRLLSHERDPVAIDYIVNHSPYESAAQIEAVHQAWLERIAAEIDLEVGDRTFQVYQLNKKGLTQRETAVVLGVSRTTVRNCLANARRRPRLARSLDAIEHRQP